MFKKLFIIAFILVSTTSFAKNRVYLSSDVYKHMNYTDDYINQGALVRSIDYKSVNQLKDQLSEIYGLELDDRKEAHITTITPPEFAGWAHPEKLGLHNLFTIGEIHSLYRSTIQETNFKVHCIGRRIDGDKTVFFLVIVDAEGLFDIRKDLLNRYEEKANLLEIETNFDFEKFWPHITIGYVNGDVHKFSKGIESCINEEEIELVIR